MRLKLRVKPGAPRTRVVGPYGDRLKVDVAAPPEKGEANAALIAFLADRLGVSRDRISVVRGASSRDKEVAVTGLDLGVAMRKLAP